MRRLARTVGSLLPLGGLLPVAAQAKDAEGRWTITGAARARLETIDGQFRSVGPGDDTALFLRERLKVQYDQGPLFIGGEVVDSRVYFEKRRSTVSANDVDAVEPVQAYLGVRLTPNAVLTAGRFTMTLGSGRLVADPVFRNTPNGFTGARFDWKTRSGDAFTGFWTLPQQHLPSDLDGVRDNAVELDHERLAQQFFGGIATKSGVLGGKLEAYVYRLYERDDPGDAFLTRNRRLWTYGGRLVRAPKPGQVDWEIEAARQTGSARLTTAASDRTDRSVNAGFVHAAAGRSFRSAWTPRLQLAFDYGSGDGSGAHYGRFDGLFGSRTSDFGPTGLYGFIAAYNLVSAELRAEAKPTPRDALFAEVRPVWTARSFDLVGNSGLKDAVDRFGHYAGTQIEARLQHYLIPKKLRLSADAIRLFKGRLLTDTAGAPRTGDTTYAYAELDFTF